MSDHTRPHRAHWECQPQAQEAYSEILSDLLAGCTDAKGYAARLLDGAGIRIADIVDHLMLADGPKIAELEKNGWAADGPVLRNSEGHFPPVLRADRNAIMIRVEAIETFAQVNGLKGEIKGTPFAPLRLAQAFEGESGSLGIVERNGGTGFTVTDDNPDEIRQARLFLQAFRSRRRQFDSPSQGLDAVEHLVDAAVAAIGPHRACAFWLIAERDYCMRRCAAGRLQKARQDSAGVGWSNIDHHTYDSSRLHFRQTIRILEKLGYQRREMLYAG